MHACVEICRIAAAEEVGGGHCMSTDFPCSACVEIFEDSGFRHKTAGRQEVHDIDCPYDSILIDAYVCTILAGWPLQIKVPTESG